MRSNIIANRRMGSRQLEAHLSSSVHDEDWDAFLQSVPTGHFQQSSIWGRIKGAEGWKVARVAIRDSEGIRGGFQILTRRRGLLREAFLNKGPVLAGPDSDLANWLLEILKSWVRQQRVQVLLVQPPDADIVCEPLFEKFLYLPNILGKLITATFCIPIGPKFPAYESRMRRSLRLESRQAKKRGLLVREGTAADIPLFFEMMSASAIRQSSTPNPATVPALLTLWENFHNAGHGRLTLATENDRPVAGLFSIRFGDRVTQWKKGWTGEAREKHPNTLLAVESVEWAEKAGAALVDFAGGNRSLANTLIQGAEPSEAQRSSRDFYLMGLGAEPRLLPLPRVYLPMALGRTFYRFLLGTHFGKKRLAI